MKKILVSVCIVLSMLAGSVPIMAAGNNIQQSLNRVVSLKIMEGFEDGELHEEEFVTRAEFSAMLIRMLGMEQVAESMQKEEVFSDVPADHWANQYINLAYQNRLINGIGNNQFAPEENITYEEAVKLLVLALGYYPEAEQYASGTWYQKYLIVGNNVGLLSGIDIPVGTVLTRGQVAVLIDSALDVDLMVRVYNGDETAYEIRQGHTLLDVLTEGGTQRYGILEATATVSLLDYGDLNSDEIYIDGQRYYYFGEKVDQYVGKCVTYFVSGTDETVVLDLFEQQDRNQEMTLDGDDITSFENDVIEYWTDNDRTVKVHVSPGAALLLNGGIYEGNVEDLIRLPNLTLRLLSNDNDTVYDVIYADNYEIAKVMRVNTFDQSIHLKNMLSNDSRSLSLEADADQVISLKNMSGEEVSIEDVKEEDTILQIKQSYDGMQIEIIWLNEPFEGSVTGINIAEEQVTIDEQVYEAAENSAGTIIDFNSIEMGSTYAVTLDTNGKIVDMDKELSGGKFRLGYLYQTGTKGGGFSDEYVFKLLGGTTVETVEVDDTYYIKGTEKQELYTYEVSSKVNIDGTKCEEENILKFIQPGDVFYYSLNSNDEINKIEICSTAADYRERNLNAKQGILASSGSGFGIDEDTVVFFVPNGTEENDFFSEMQFKDGTYSCSGFNFVENTVVVEAAVFNTGVDSAQEVTFGELDPYCIVQGISVEIDEDGNEVYRISGYREEQEFNTISTPDAAGVNDILATVQTGDIIRYKTDFDGRINAVRVLEIEPGTKNPAPLSPDRRFFHIGSASSSEEQIFGVVAEAQSKDLDTSAVKYVNRLRISLNADGSSPEDAILLDYDERTAPDYYSYDYDRGEITPVTFDDIISVNDSDADSASKVFAYAQNGTFEIVVIVR